MTLRAADPAGMQKAMAALLDGVRADLAASDHIGVNARMLTAIFPVFIRAFEQELGRGADSVDVMRGLSGVMANMIATLSKTMACPALNAQDIAGMTLDATNAYIDAILGDPSNFRSIRLVEAGHA